MELNKFLKKQFIIEWCSLYWFVVLRCSYFFHLFLKISLPFVLQLDNVKYVHYLGAGLAFGMGTIFTWLQVYLSYRMIKIHCTHRTGTMFCSRLVIALTATIAVVGSIIFAFIKQWYLYLRALTTSTPGV